MQWSLRCFCNSEKTTRQGKDSLLTKKHIARKEHVPFSNKFRLLSKWICQENIYPDKWSNDLPHTHTPDQTRKCNKQCWDSLLAMGAFSSIFACAAMPKTCVHNSKDRCHQCSLGHVSFSLGAHQAETLWHTSCQEKSHWDVGTRFGRYFPGILCRKTRKSCSNVDMFTLDLIVNMLWEQLHHSDLINIIFNWRVVACKKLLW